MVTINYAFREISCKIVYYGPGLSGKTTNLQYVHDRVPSKSRGDLISLATEADRTLFFDFLPIHVGDIAGFATKFQLYTVPGQVFYNATRKLVLRGVDGIVFVADSQKSKMDENIESLSNMFENLRENSIEVADIPIVIQYNKRDLPEVATIEELQKQLNTYDWPYAEASAVSGIGVFDTLKRITKLVLEQTKRRTAVTPDGVPRVEETVTLSPTVGAPPLRTPDHSGATAEERSFETAGASKGWSVASETATAVAEQQAAHHAEDQVPGRPDPTSGTTVSRTTSPQGRPVIAAQPSLRIRARQRSFWSRLFGWLSGR
jgi:mutual gliding-motility protein MglA